MLNKLGRTTLAAAAAGGLAVAAGPASADTFNLTFASGHAPQTGYVEMMEKFFAPRIQAAAEKAGHKINITHAYGGSVVKVAETLEGAKDGLIDVGGYCFCFEPSNLFLHVYPLWMPFDAQNAKLGVDVARTVYDATPFMSEIFEKQYNQKLLGLFGFDNYGLYTTFKWDDFTELKGRKIGAAGPNLPWVEAAGAVPVGTTLPDVYPSLQTGVYDGIVLFPSVGWSHKLFEPAPNYKIVGFGSKAFHGLVVNLDTFNSMPKELQDILIREGRAYEEESGPSVDAEEATNIGLMVMNGAIVTKISPEAQKAWAETLADFPNERAQEANQKGLPGTKVLSMAVDVAEKLGHVWPVRYEIK